MGVNPLSGKAGICFGQPTASRLFLIFLSALLSFFLSSYRVFYFYFLSPELFKPGGIGGGIADGVLDVPVAEVILNEPGIRALVR